MLWNQCTIFNKILFWFAESCDIFAISTKWLKSTTFNDKFSWNFTHTKKIIIKNNLFHQSF